MNILLISVVIIALFACTDAKFCHSPNKTKPDCAGTFEVVHKCNSAFVNHAMNTTNPFVMCTDSYTFFSFRYTMEFYSNLFTMKEKNDGHFCSEEFLSKNRMNVISTLIANTKKLWDDAYCDKCYQNITSANHTFSFDTQRFFNFSNAFDDCVNTTKRNFNESVICVECYKAYQNLNKFFEELKKSSDKKVCFDIEDRMNKTRKDWSGEYKCCKEKRDSLTAFYSLAATIFIIAISFYCAAYFIGSKYPEIEPLDEQEVTRIAPIEDTNTTSSTAGIVPGPSSSSTHHRNTSKPKKSDKQLIINDDSDDEILISPSIQQQSLSQLINLNN